MLNKELEEEIVNINEGIKNILIEQIFYQKYKSKNYEIDCGFFIEAKVSAFGNCLYCCVSLHLYHNEEHHM